MIQALHLLFYPQEDVYRDVCGALGLSPDKAKGQVFVPPEETTKGIRAILPYNILYGGDHRIWFLHLHLNFPAFDCAYEALGDALYDALEAVLGAQLVKRVPYFIAACCDYIEYAGIVDVGDADATLARLRATGKMKPEQLERTRWGDFHKPHATIEFCVSRLDGARLETLARCHGTALKQRIEAKVFHRTVGLRSEVAVNEQVEADILQWLYEKNKVIMQ